MPSKKQIQRERAERLRMQIEELKIEGEERAANDSPEQQPGESPKAYVERREREIGKKKRPGK